MVRHQLKVVAASVAAILTVALRFCANCYYCISLQFYCLHIFLVGLQKMPVISVIECSVLWEFLIVCPCIRYNFALPVRNCLAGNCLWSMCKPAESCIKEEDEEEFVQLFTEYIHHGEKDGTDPTNLLQSEFAHRSEMSQSDLVKVESSVENEALNKEAIDVDIHHSIGQSMGQGTVRNATEGNTISEITGSTSNSISKLIDVVVPSSGQGTCRVVSRVILEVPRRRHRDRKHLCTVCGAKFLCRRYLERHMTIHT